MKFVWAAVYTGLFIVGFVGGSLVAAVLGVGQWLVVSSHPAQFRTYSELYEAVRTANTINGVIGLAFAIVLVTALWSMRNPGGLGRKRDAFVAKVKAPKGWHLVVYWIAAVCTVVLYPLAIYATWRYIDARRTHSTGGATERLSSRLADLDAARDAGLITPEEHAAKRATTIEAF
jgi:hypothetical protein